MQGVHDHDHGTDRLAAAFRDGETVGEGENHAVLSRRHVADLIAPTGELVACDPPTVEFGIAPFATRLTPGRYPVILTLARFPTDEVERVAYATVQVREGLPARWEVAQHTHGAGSAKQTVDIDTGTACVMDAEAAQVVQRRLAADPDFGMVHEEAMEQTWVESWGWADIRLDPNTTANMVTFSAGAGDGAYTAYWGYGSDDSLICLTLDFELVSPDEM